MTIISINGTSDVTNAFLASVGSQTTPQSPLNSFVASRFPYTYAYDLVRFNSVKAMGRSTVADLLRKHVDGNEDEAARVCTELALIYCAQHGIKVPDAALEPPAVSPISAGA